MSCCVKEFYQMASEGIKETRTGGFEQNTNKSNLWNELSSFHGHNAKSIGLLVI